MRISRNNEWYKYLDEQREKLRDLIQNEQTDRAIDMVRNAQDYEEGENFVFVVFEEEKSTPELREAALEAFLATRKDEEHGEWVHSLSHLTNVLLWKHRIDKWIKIFYDVAFKGANELYDSRCCDRLVNDFGSYSSWDDDPIDFHLTPSNLRWMKWLDEMKKEYLSYSMARIEAGRFESEEAFLRWKLQRPEMQVQALSETSNWFTIIDDLIKITEIRSIIRRLREINAGIKEFDGLEKELLGKQKDLLTKRLNYLKTTLSEAKNDRSRNEIKEMIQETYEKIGETELEMQALQKQT